MNIHKQLSFLIIVSLTMQSCDSSPQNIFGGLLIIIVHLMIIAGLFGMIYFIFKDIKNEHNNTESIIKILSIVLGLFIYFASKALNISLSDLIIGSMETTQPIAVGIIGIISPTLLGIIIAWYVKKIFESKEIIAKRIIFIFATFILAMFGEVYLASFSIESNLKLLPNVMFVVGIISYIVLGFSTDKK